ncbi:MAG: hypothetical protein MMC33_003800 [Icmadophila ericetorum]|nr:hypothetical protein [Icmadophila ericetorum]
MFALEHRNMEREDSVSDEKIDLGEVTSPPTENSEDRRNILWPSRRYPPPRDENDYVVGEDDGYQFRGDLGNINEVVAPSLVQNRDEDPIQSNVYLEDRTETAAISGRETLRGVDGISKRMTELYMVSYLIFFSFCGTASRLVLEALTFYPGAPVMTSVL